MSPAGHRVILLLVFSPGLCSFLTLILWKNDASIASVTFAFGFAVLLIVPGAVLYLAARLSGRTWMHTTAFIVAIVFAVLFFEYLATWLFAGIAAIWAGEGLIAAALLLPAVLLRLRDRSRRSARQR
jgi:hypothetical protein